MLCPIDQTELVMTDRQGVEIDYCPKCRGVWLDRGELDKIIERSESVSAGASGATSIDDKRFVGRTPEVGGMRGNVQRMADRARRDDDDDDDDRYDDRYDDRGRPRKKKRGSFLGELFDFD
jgi:uncharacterized protein